MNIDRVISFFTSLRLTVVCLCLGLVLVFFGTLAQVDLGLYQAQNDYFRSFFVLWGPKGAGWRIPVFPGGYLVGALLLLNLVAAHIKRFNLSKNKTGLFLIHIGLILLLLGQLLTDMLSTESVLHLRVGEGKNYSEEPRRCELALVDTTDPETDKVVVLGEETLAARKPVQPSDLPFTVKVQEYYANSDLALTNDLSQSYQQSTATRGSGVGIWLKAQPRSTSTDVADMQSALVEVSSKDGTLGTWLVSVGLAPQTFTFDNHNYQIALRRRRHYQPFSLELVKFNHATYMGTDIPKDFSSRVRLRRLDTGEDREALIYMNNPLRYGGETFYQASYDADDRGTVLQVVHNPSWLTPYLSCALIGLGMLIQFLMHLVPFLKARLRKVDATGELAISASSPRPSPPVEAREKEVALAGLSRAPWLVVLIASALVLLSLHDKPEAGFHTHEFGRLPVLLNGRIQPFDSVARNSLLQIRGKQSVFLADTNKADMFPQGQSLSATEWLMGVMMKPEQADDQKVFRIDNPELLALLKLSDREKYFSFSQLAPNFEELRRQDLRIESEKREAQSRTAFEKQVVKLLDSMMLYQRLVISLRPPESVNLTHELDGAWKDIVALRANRAEASQAATQPEAVQLGQYLTRWRFMADYSTVLVISPGPGESHDSWKSMGASLTNLLRADQLDPAVAQYAKMVTAYRANQSLEFNSAVAGYRLMLGQRFSSELAKGQHEFFFNSFAPFYKALVIYLLAFILACASWFNFSSLLRRSAFYLVVLAWCIHTFGLVFRMILEGRPPVTNLYSSAIFIGWGAAILGMILEKIYRDGIGSVIAATVGFLTLIIAHNLALGGDTMEMLRAVLDTNFWLATHVTVVTLGYSATFVAGFLAIIYVIRGVFTRSLDNVATRSLARMVYGIVCFATLFSFAGTILGGIWADQSWGRFWGWDPKENGALLIVLWNAVILHARWGGLVRERGLMIMAIFGNVVTGWSWFGVNMLGIGLHSYGFTDQAFWWLLMFVASQVVLIGGGALPKRWWRSDLNEKLQAPIGN